MNNEQELEIAPSVIVFSDVYNEESYMHAKYIRFLYDLLLERDNNVNINHKEKTAWENHVKFVKSWPYRFWEIIHTQDDPDRFIGAIYVTHKNEIGIFIRKSEQRRGYAEAAVAMMIESYPDQEFTANINAKNAASMALFEKLGFELSSCVYKKLATEVPVLLQAGENSPPQTS